ncbi:MAG: O-antigen ligase family protein [Armatimonadota bacterium]
MSDSPDARKETPSPIDPWEARERERERYSRPADTPRKMSAGGKESISFEAGGYVAAGLTISIALLLLGDTPRIREDLRSLFIAAGTIIPFLLFAFIRFYVDDLRIAVRRGPNPWILALLAWSLVAFYVSPYRQISAIVSSDLVRVFSGGVIYLLAAYGLRSPREVSNAAVGLTCLGVLVGLAEFYDIGGSHNLSSYVRLNTIFGSHEGLGTLLMLALPVPLAFVLNNETEEKRRLVGLAATLILGVALVMARTRSAWIGITAAFLALILFNHWLSGKLPGRSQRGSKPQRQGNAVISFLTSPATLLVLTLVGILIFTGVSSFIQSRASLQTAIVDSGHRFDLWKAGARMTSDRPLTGWGLGSFLILQGRWSHIGDDVAAIMTRGADESNNAHNYYVQWAADTGAVGLFLHIAAVTAFLVIGLRGLWNLRRTSKSSLSNVPTFQKTLLAGCVAAVIGGCVDMIASPAYTFHSLSSIFWLLMGLGVAALRPATTASTAVNSRNLSSPVPALPSASLFSGIIPPLAGGAAAAIVLFVGHQQTAVGRRLPRGTFQIVAVKQKPGPVLAGDKVLWQAVYRDHKGVRTNTYPGTIWEFSSPDALALEQMKRSVAFSRYGKHPDFDSSLSITAPSGTAQPITAHASFYDAYSRRYDAWSSVSVSRTIRLARPKTKP